MKYLLILLLLTGCGGKSVLSPETTHSPVSGKELVKVEKVDYSALRKECKHPRDVPANPTVSDLLELRKVELTDWVECILNNRNWMKSVP